MLTLNDADVSKSVVLELKTYILTVYVTNGNIPIEGMTVVLDGYGTHKTNVYGKVIVGDVLPDMGMGYEVSGKDYYTQTGDIEGVAEDGYKKIVLTKKRYNLTVQASDGDGPVEGMDSQLHCECRRPRGRFLFRCITSRV